MDATELTTSIPPENFSHLGRLKNGGEIKGVRNVGSLESSSHLRCTNSWTYMNHLANACNWGSFIHLQDLDDTDLEIQENLKEAKKKKFIKKYEENREGKI